MELPRSKAHDGALWLSCRFDAEETVNETSIAILILIFIFIFLLPLLYCTVYLHHGKTEAWKGSTSVGHFTCLRFRDM